LRRAQVELVLPRRGRQGSPLRATIRLTNRSRWLPLPPLRFRLRSRAGDEGDVVTPSVAPGVTTSGVGRIVVSRRGWLELERIEMSSDFPFGLSGRKARWDRPPGRSLVFPCPAGGKAGRSPRRRGEHTDPRRSSGLGEDPMDAREYHVGDDARRMDWKASARTERLIWRDRRGSPPSSVAVRLDRSGPAGQSFEDRVSKAAGAVSSALSSGMAVAFETDECEIPARTGSGHRRKIFEYLALVRPAGERAAP
jgi:uncharacterized protein (DUF58 family)